MSLASFLVDLCLAAALALVTTWALQGWIVFARPKRIRPLSPGPNTAFEFLELTLPRPDGPVLRGWCARPTVDSLTTNVLIYFGGRREHVAWVPAMASYLPGWTIYSFAYRGFAGSTGLPSDSSTKRDAQSIYFHLRSIHRGRIDRLALCGRSLGCSAAVWLARDTQPHDLVLISPFDSMSSLVARLPFGALIAPLLAHPLHVSQYASRVFARTLILSAADDTLIPPSLTRRLLNEFPSPPRFVVVPSTNHKSLPRNAAAQAIIAEHLLSQPCSSSLPRSGPRPT